MLGVNIINVVLSNREKPLVIKTKNDIEEYLSTFFNEEGTELLNSLIEIEPNTWINPSHIVFIKAESKLLDW
ncbi:hypothetical protein [Bacillus sp. MRMR6]|uniref:hypothetical protein n=1 Tax=Bacillus sp. MRMR6 TaxID=1928617 RepID=UPI000951850C|nr:hypothetical protein [Bacillus sp. MRMR6]OLS39120.1 hypothetical protein BTR25_13390 [Bacillus sp. MRMR6]